MIPVTEAAPRIGQTFGVHTAVVVDIVDPDGQGRVRIGLPWSPDTGDGSYEAWARLATAMAGNERGTWFIPDVGDEVLVCFEAGDPSRPFVIGALWNGVDAPPETMDGAGDNNVSSITSRNGVTISLDDTSGSETLVLETPGGQKVTLADGPSTITIEDGNGNRAVLESGGVTIDASAKVSVSASTMEVSAGSLTVNAGMSTFNGVVKADTVIANAVVSSSYTPGAGNIW